MFFRCLSTALAGLMLSGSAFAAVFTVNTLADAPDATPGDGLCRMNGFLPSQCTLRAAIMEANALAGLDVVRLSPGQVYVLTRIGEDDTALLGDLDITGDMIIGIQAGDQLRPIVDANGIDRVFDIHSANVSFQNFDITGGVRQVPGTDGGGIRKQTGNMTVALDGMRVYDNVVADDGAAIHAVFGEVKVNDSWLFDNRGSNAISMSGTSRLTLDGSAVTGQRCIQGTGCAAIEAQSQSTVTLLNSTISGNDFGLFMLNSGNVTLRNATIAANADGGIFVSNGGNLLVSMSNTVLAGNGGSNCDLMINPNIVYVINNHNASSDGSCGFQNGATNLSSAQVLLTPLKFRGGATPIHWPRPGSALIEGGPGAVHNCEEFDQHGWVRPQDYGMDGISSCDIGAAEVPADAIFFDSNEVVIAP